jgi:hypothetical protein
VPVKSYDQSDVCTYLLTRGGGADPDLEPIILGLVADDPTKDALLSLRVLDMTPGFGVSAARLVETMAYLSFLLPYREKHSFVAEWENERRLHEFILGEVLYGVETYPFSLDVLRNSLRSRFSCEGANYRLGNPLLGMSVMELSSFVGAGARDMMSRLREMYRSYSALSYRIKEDALVKGELAARLTAFRKRLGEIMDLVMASYFDENVRVDDIGGLLGCLDTDEASWHEAGYSGRFAAAREVAQRKRFFHMEIEFPFLLDGGFDLILVQSSFRYLWEEKMPPREVTMAYIRRAMTYLKKTGVIACAVDDADGLMSDLRASRRYVATVRDGVVMVKSR